VVGSGFLITLIRGTMGTTIKTDSGTIIHTILMVWEHIYTTLKWVKVMLVNGNSMTEYKMEHITGQMVVSCMSTMIMIYSQMTLTQMDMDTYGSMAQDLLTSI